jgi:sugar lactone lactonase YvrE
MAVKTAKSTISKPVAKATTARLFFLSASSGQVFSANADGSDLKVIVSEGRRLPDGIVVDAEAGHLYWTNMGNPTANDGSIERADFDGTNLTHIVPPGGTFTPKQLQLDEKNRKLYWCDREGMRVMRANLDRNASRYERRRLTSWEGHKEMVRGNRTRRQSRQTLLDSEGSGQCR